MNPDRLESLLKNVDAAAPRPRCDARLAARVVERVHQQPPPPAAAVRWAALTAAATLLVGLAVWSLWRAPAEAPKLAQPAPPAADESSAEQVERLREELAALDRDIRSRMAAIDQLWSELDARSSLRELETFALTLEAHRPPQAAETAADVHLAAGDYLLRELRHPRAAAAAYERTVERYPNTTSAQRAAERLAQLQNFEQEMIP